MDFLRPLGISQQELADAIAVPYHRINLRLVHERNTLTMLKQIATIDGK
jgi:plasmid maintenance system antidote protein VapI